MRNQKSLSKCIDRYVLVEKKANSLQAKSKLFNKTFIIESGELEHDDMKKLNEILIQEAHQHNEKKLIDVPTSFINWVVNYLKQNEINAKIIINGCYIN